MTALAHSPSLCMAKTKIRTYFPYENKFGLCFSDARGYAAYFEKLSKKSGYLNQNNRFEKPQRGDNTPYFCKRKRYFHSWLRILIIMKSLYS